MSATTLEPEELDAIRAAMQQAQPVSLHREQIDAVPVAIIADNRAAERGRPTGLKIATRWARQVTRHLARVTGSRIDVAVTGVETIDGAAMRADTGDAWTARVRVGADVAIIAVTGPMIESVVARLLGDTSTPTTTSERAPSPVARRLFGPAGGAIVAALVEAWRDELGVSLEIDGTADVWRRGVADSDLVLMVSLTSTAPAGVIRLLTRPETLAGPALPYQTNTPLAAIEAALGDVPVEIEVELGHARLTMTELLALQPGAVIALDRLVDDPVPVTCDGVVKAYGKPIVNRGAIAVEIVATHRNEDK